MIGAEAERSESDATLSPVVVDALHESGLFGLMVPKELGGEEADRWAEIRARQQTLPGRRRWDGEPAPLVRPGPRVAYTQDAPPSWSPLAERVVEAMWTLS